MEQLWLLCVVIAVMVLLVVIFHSSAPKEQTTYRVSRHKAVAADNGVCGDLEGASGQRCVDREMLKSFYPPPLMEDTPIDYPKKAIGACPYSREMSKPLPLTDIPICLMDAF